MNIITDKNNQLIMRQTLRKRKLCLVTRAAFLALCALIFVTPAKAQDVLMRDGTTVIERNMGTIHFYDSHGPSQPHNYWEHWYNPSEEFTYVFKPKVAGDKIKVTFGLFTAYGDEPGVTYPDPNNYDGVSIGQWTLRLNDDFLDVYQGEEASSANLIASYTGNTKEPFTIISDGAITFHFKSNTSYREEGWAATINLVKPTDDGYNDPTAPFIKKSTCSDEIELVPTMLNYDHIYYTTDGTIPSPDGPDSTDPLNSTKEYTGAIEWPAGNLTVKAMTVVGNEKSVISSKTFTDADRTPIPGKPTINVNGNVVTMTPAPRPAGLNDTYQVYYTMTTNGSEPGNPDQYSTLYTGPITCSVAGTKFKAVTVALSCHNQISTSYEEATVAQLYAPAPVIDFNTMTITAKEGNITYDILYAIDGTPSVNETTGAVTGEYSATQVSLADLVPGQTVRAIAYRAVANNENHTANLSYHASEMVSAIYIPEDGSGVYTGGIVLLDDREPHSWSYYSDSVQPVHSLKPADVKITYLGYGEKTMTTTDTSDEPTVFNGDVDAEAVAVGPNEDGNQFIYLKTLENANEDGSGNYPYTLIPNPFSKRPTYNNSGSAPTTRTIYLVTTGNNNGRGTLTVTYTNANGISATETVNINSGNFSNTRSITAKVGGTITYSLQRTAGTVRSGAYYDTSNGTEIWYVTRNTNGTSTPANPYTVQASASSDTKYRGFYAWRVKNLSNGLTIKRANGNTVAVGGIINAEEEVEFLTSNAEGNEVDFEALWAQAYVVTSNTATGLHTGVSYERNFIVGATPSALNVPVTYSSYYPDGTSAGTASVNGFTCAADTKFEYMTISGGTFTAANHYLCMGRGLTGTASMIQGINGGATNLDYMLRVESGTYNELAFVRTSGNGGVTGRYIVKSILGCDYDRAKQEDGNLTVSQNNQLFFSLGVTFSGSSNKDQKTFDLIVKSGKYQENFWDDGGDGLYDHSFYCGQNQSGSSYPGMRFVTVEGGQFGSMNGGRGTSSNNNASTDVVTFDVRIKNGTFNGSVFGAAADNPSPGSRKIVVTGGTIKGWVAGGCNGTGNRQNNSQGNTEGDSFVYVGGDAIIGGNSPITVNGTAGGQVFGAGRGAINEADNIIQTAYIINSNVVVADSAKIASNVYGGGNYGYLTESSNVHILGGVIDGNVFGGAYSNRLTIPVSNVFVKGGEVKGNVYGGCDQGGQVTSTIVNVSGGLISNVFGAGLGIQNTVGNGTYQNIDGNTKVTVSGGTINNNVYGGGEEGVVNGATSVAISGGEVKNDVFGAGMGSGNSTANVAGGTTVAVSGGLINGEVYGGGEEGKVNQAATANIGSKVTISGGEIKKDVFGGGKNGTTNGKIDLTVSGGILRLNVFGGAYGTHGSVYVAGQKTVNIMGGRIYGSVYGGSRNANDALSLNPGTFSHVDENDVEIIDATDDETCSVTNVSGGRIEQHVYAAGYYGVTYGSVYAFVGLNAINDAPNHYLTPSIDYTKGTLIIKGNVWAGGDWGTFSGDFGAPTVSGNSNIYVDGTGYSTNGNDASAVNFMNIEGSIYGCGTSCDAGNKDRVLILSNYGADVANTDSDVEVNPVARTTRQLTSLQRFHNAIISNAHVSFLGQGKINSLNNTEKYAIYEIGENIYFANGSTFVMNHPSSQIKSFRSVTIDDVYNDSPSDYTVVDYDDLGSTSGPTDNKIRVNGGSYIEIKYTPSEDGKIYGELQGFCHMMTSNDSHDATCAYARPKQSEETGNILPSSASDYYNLQDGGFVSYRSIDNQYTASGAYEEEGNQVQLRYENHYPGLTKDNSEYYRIWHYGGINQEVEVVMNAEATGNEGYKTVEVTVQLPSWDNKAGGYFKFASTGTSSLNTLIDYGSQVITYNAANSATDTWMYFDGSQNQTTTFPTETPYPDTHPLTPGLTAIEDNPNLNFGLVLIPGNAMSGNSYIICSDADNYLANLAQPFPSTDITSMPTITLRLTYRDDISSNAALDPMYIPLIQCNANGNVINNVTLKIQINTSTMITSGLTTKVFARMTGGLNSKVKAKTTLVLPTFEVYQSGEESHFKVTNVEFRQGTEGVALGDNAVQYTKMTSTDLNIDRFALTVTPAPNPDNTDDWRFTEGEIDGVGSEDLEWGDSNVRNKVLGEAGGRSTLSLDFTLYYNENPTVNEQSMMGEVEFTIEIDNYKYGIGSNHTINFTVTVQVYRIGSGKNFYVANWGEDKKDRGRFPDIPAKTVNYIFNRLNFLPGDNILVVDNLPINVGTTWDGSGFQNEVNIYRYPGAHGLSGTSINPDFVNDPYTGALVTVNKELTLKGITMDGIYAEAIKPEIEHNTIIYPDACDFDGKADKPLIEVNDGGRLNLTSATVLRNNYSKDNGGAVNVVFGGVLAMNQDAEISNNHSEKLGAGVYMDGAMIVSDYVKVFDNTKGTAQSNIWLTEAEENVKDDVYKVIQIGTSANDAYGDLKSDENGAAKLGVDKDDWSHSVYGFMPVVYAETGTEDYLELPYEEPQTIIVHDKDIYSLKKYMSPNYLYWIFTWVEAVTSKPEGFDAEFIDTPEELAWAISIVNGENNVEGTDDHKPGQAFTITKDIDMSQYIWVPIGSERFNYSGQFEGNGHVVTGLRSAISEKNVGMFGTTNGANISNMIVNASFTPSSDNLGTVIGTMNGGSLSNVEGSGTLENKNNQGVVGGLVGTTNSNVTIHSSFAVPTMKGGKNMGGLVGVNAGNLYNSYVNATMSGATNIGGLAGVNNGRIENCYVVLGTQSFPAFAKTNAGTITLCYSDKQGSYIGDGTAPTNSGYYAAVKGIKEYGYMYDDNLVTASGNPYSNHTEHEYLDDDHTVVWNGLLSVLNQWVANGYTSYTTWNRPTSANINGDLPVLAFPKDNSLATTDGKYLRYSASDEIKNGVQANNGLDMLLTEFASANIYLYQSAIGVKNGTGNNNLFIHEDAALIQAEGKDLATIKATVGVTFDNSCKSAVSTGDPSMPLTYDWHLMSTPLSNAPMGISWSDGQVNWWDTQDWNDAIGQVTGVSGSYLPDGTGAVSHWDFYTYYEPEYHWINFKRNSSSHAHYEEPHDWIAYSNEANLVPGKGYMAAIDQDSYLSNTGTLNNGEVPIKLTYSNDGTGLEAPTKDWGSNLVGNPYQAYLDLNAVADGTGYTKFYIYSAETNQYVPFTKDQSSNTWTPSQFIHPHQAFFVLTNATDGNFKFTYDMATASKDENGNSYFRKGAQIDYPLINLFAKDEAGALNYTIIEVGRPELGGAEKTEALKTTDFDLYAHYGQIDYKLLFTPEEAQRVAVFFNTKKDGTYTLSWDTQNGEFSFLHLIDNITGVEVDMLDNDHYTFEGLASDYASRFYILFNNPNVEPGGNGNGNGNGEIAYFDGYGWIVNGEGILELIDVTGRVLYREYLAGDMNRIHLDNFKTGAYVLKLGDMTQKIIIK